MKMKKYYMCFAGMFLMAGCMFTQPDYLTMISAPELKQLMQREDVFLLDVHIPQQQHIKGTDLFIPYNNIENYQAQLPVDKNTPIYIYCEGGPMGNSAARTLNELGYSNLYNLKGGAQAWRSHGFEFE
jgi:rhodanese-related sulfurtransferase